METLTQRTNELSGRVLLTTILEEMDEHAVEKRLNIFSDLCSRLLDDIVKEEVIRERSLIDFSKQVLRIVNGAIEKLPESFERLADYIADYWRYELKEEQDSERKYSYIRLFQMINLVKICYRGRAQEKKALLALEAHKEHTEMLDLMQRRPGITHKELRKQLEVSSGRLRQQLEPLEKDGFLSTRRTGEERYYMLTNAGEVLVKNLKLQQSNDVWREPWSANRFFVLLVVLDFMRKHGINSIDIVEAVQSVTQYSEDEISQIVKNFRKPQSPTEKYNYITWNKDVLDIPFSSHSVIPQYAYSLCNITMKKAKEGTVFMTRKNMFLKNEIHNLETKICKTNRGADFSEKSQIREFN